MAGVAAWQVQRRLVREHPELETSSVVRGDVESRVTALGVLQPRSYVDVGAQVSGVIKRLAVEDGAKVKEGDLLIEIDPSVQQAVVDAGRASLANLNAQLVEQRAQHTLAVQQFNRQIEMGKHDATRIEDIQTAEAAAKVAAARIDSILAQISQTEATQRAEEVRLGYTRIYAPMSGTIVALDARQGQTLNATYQTPRLLRIADLSTMTVWTEVSEADVRRVKAGMPAYFNTLGADRRRWDGKVRQILPAPPSANKGSTEETSASNRSSKVVAYTALFDVDNHDGDLMPQMTAQVSFVREAARDVLIAPLSALVKETGGEGRPDTYQARVIDSSGGIVSRAVVIGLRDRVNGQVLKGLSENEKLVTSAEVAE